MNKKIFYLAAKVSADYMGIALFVLNPVKFELGTQARKKFCNAT